MSRVAASLWRRLTGRQRPKVLVLGGAEDVLQTYKHLLGRSYDSVICDNGADAQRWIDDGQAFHVAIMHMILSPGTPESPKLIDYQEAGLRLLEQLLERGLCYRFYVITVSRKMELPVRQTCRKYRALCRFQHLMTFDPDEFVAEVRRLSTASLDEKRYTLTGLRLGILETQDYLALCKRLSGTPDSLDGHQTARLGAAMTWLFEALDNPAFTDFFRENALTDPKVRQTWAEWLQALEEIRVLLEREFEPHTQGELHSEIEGALAAILSFSGEFRLPETA